MMQAYYRVCINVQIAFFLARVMPGSLKVKGSVLAAISIVCSVKTLETRDSRGESALA